MSASHAVRDVKGATSAGRTKENDRVDFLAGRFPGFELKEHEEEHRCAFAPKFVWYQHTSAILGREREQRQLDEQRAAKRENCSFREANSSTLADTCLTKCSFTVEEGVEIWAIDGDWNHCISIIRSAISTSWCQHWLSETALSRSISAFDFEWEVLAGGFDNKNWTLGITLGGKTSTSW
ncbi:unnamed protein product [Dibothriocephalus latus]|uniref:Uncharacterized protein n=1 Tax=Dibothriocephalus latus TaxID=60516 RepID=A0A3P7LY88_DIBLA|nr:unnamed protein product [Dibothriocephalus latus]